MNACSMLCGSDSMTTSAMTRVALYAGKNCFIQDGRGMVASRPKGSRNMRISRKNRPNGKPSTTKPR